jgi:hypothetical protein
MIISTNTLSVHTYVYHSPFCSDTNQNIVCENFAISDLSTINGIAIMSLQVTQQQSVKTF